MTSRMSRSLPFQQLQLLLQCDKLLVRWLRDAEYVHPLLDLGSLQDSGSQSTLVTPFGTGIRAFQKQQATSIPPSQS